MNPPPRLQVVVAHPDDETFGCGSLLLHAKAAGVLEVDRVRLLAFADSAMSGELPPGALCAAEIDDVVDAVRDEIEGFGPDVVVTLDASYGHRDHARIRDATISAARAAGVARVYLMCLPRSLMRRWADRMRIDRPHVEYLDVDAAALGTPDEHLTTIIDVCEHMDQRQRAIEVHASQTSPLDGLPNDLRRDFLASVHAIRVQPPWTGGALESTLFLRSDPS